MRVYGIGERPLIGTYLLDEACLSRERGGNFRFRSNGLIAAFSALFRNLSGVGRAMLQNPEFVALPIVSRAARRTALLRPQAGA